MTTADVNMWKRCEEMALDYHVTITLKSRFELLSTEKEQYLGAFETVRDMYFFLTGFEHSVGKVCK